MKGNRLEKWDPQFNDLINGGGLTKFFKKFSSATKENGLANQIIKF